MNELDKKIREALREEDAEIFNDYGGEPSMLEMVFDIYRGRHRWLVLLTTFWALVFFVLAIVAAVKFFTTEEPRDPPPAGRPRAVSGVGLSMFSINANKSVVVYNMSKCA